MTTENKPLTFGRYMIEGARAYELFEGRPEKPTDDMLVVVGPNGRMVWQSWGGPGFQAHGYLTTHCRRPLAPTPANYALLQAAWCEHFGVKVGTRVRVVGTLQAEELGYPIPEPKQSWVGHEGIVSYIESGILVCLIDGPTIWFPFHVLDPLPSQPPAPTDAKGEDRYFSYGADGDFSEHATAEDARNSAEDYLQTERDNAQDGWDECVHNICWGRILGRVTQTETRECTPEEKEAYGFDEIWEFDLVESKETYRCNVCGGLVQFDGTAPTIKSKKSGRDTGGGESAELTSLRTQLTALREAAVGAREFMEGFASGAADSGNEVMEALFREQIQHLDAALAQSTNTKGES